MVGGFYYFQAWAKLDNLGGMAARPTGRRGVIANGGCEDSNGYRIYRRRRVDGLCNSQLDHWWTGNRVYQTSNPNGIWIRTTRAAPSADQALWEPPARKESR